MKTLFWLEKWWRLFSFWDSRGDILRDYFQKENIFTGASLLDKLKTEITAGWSHLHKNKIFVSLTPSPSHTSSDTMTKIYEIGSNFAPRGFFLFSKRLRDRDFSSNQHKQLFNVEPNSSCIEFIVTKRIHTNCARFVINVIKIPNKLTFDQPKSSQSQNYHKLSIQELKSFIIGVV